VLNVLNDSSIACVPMQAEVEQWLAAAVEIEQHSRPWIEPFASSAEYTDEVCSTCKRCMGLLVLRACVCVRVCLCVCLCVFVHARLHACKACL